MCVLAWEPSADQFTKSYPRRLPALIRFLQGNEIFAIKVDPHNLESINPAKNITVGLQSSPTKIWGKSVKGFLSYDRTNIQTNINYNFIYKKHDINAKLYWTSAVYWSETNLFLIQYLNFFW